MPEPRLKKGLRKSLLLSGVALAATGVAVSSGVVLKNDTASRDSAAAAVSAAQAQIDTSTTATAPPVKVNPVKVSLQDRGLELSRSGRRTAVEPVKKKHHVTKRHHDHKAAKQAHRAASLASEDPRDVARALLAKFGFSKSEFSCLDALYMSESGWNVHADNPSSDAYGIPQALPGSKMASAGADWADNAETQIRWGLEYIKGSYGTPCGAWSFKQGNGWY